MTTSAPTNVSTWAIDPVHTSVEFGVQHLAISTYRGRFRTVEGTLRVDEANPANSSVEATIDAASIDITQDRFLGHVLSPDFLDAQSYPAITFRSTRVERVDDTHWNVTGDLTLHGQTQPVLLKTAFLGQATHPFSKKTVAAFHAEAEIDRGAFGLKWNVPLDTGAQYVGERVTITLHIEAIKQD